jgi:hypothetical protein
MHGLTEVKFTPDNIRAIMQLKEYPIPESSEKLQTTLPYSTNSPNPPNSTSLYPNRVSRVEPGESGEQKDIGGISEKLKGWPPNATLSTKESQELLGGEDALEQARKSGSVYETSLQLRYPRSSASTLSVDS